jgi:hypothetical protein
MAWDFGGFGDWLSSLVSGAGDAASSAPDLSSFVEPAAGASSIASTIGDLGGGGWDWANLGGANDAFTKASGAVGNVPTPSMPDTVGGVAPGEAQATPSANFGGGETDPEQLARQGQFTNPNSPATSSPVDAVHGQPPPPTAWESVKNAPGKWWDAASTSAANEFNKAPIATTAKVGALAAPFIGAGISALNQPKQPGKYTLNPPATPAQPLPGTTGTSSADLPAASPMSPILTGTGGFKVDKGGLGMAQGGQVGAVSDQDKADYEEAMRQFKGQPTPPGPRAQPAQPPADDDVSKQIYRQGQPPPKNGYFRPWSK